MIAIAPPIKEVINSICLFELKSMGETEYNNRMIRKINL